MSPTPRQVIQARFQELSTAEPAQLATNDANQFVNDTKMYEPPSPMSFRMLAPYLFMILRLLFHILQPFLICLFLFILFQLEESYMRWMLATATIGISWDLVRDRYIMSGFGFRYTDIQPGFFFVSSSPNDAIAQLSGLATKVHSYVSTSWLWTGGLRTLLANTILTSPSFEWDLRRFIRAEDGENIATDWKFPEKVSAENTPVVILLHGINGGSNMPYIYDLSRYLLKKGLVVVVMVSRGYMDIPLVTGNMFHCVRHTDFRSTVQFVQAATHSKNIFAVGLSMGAIVLAKYLTVYARDTQLAGACVVSGCFYTEKSIENEHSRNFWHPAVTYSLKKRVLLPNWRFVMDSGRVNMDEALAARDLVELDEKFIAPYYQFNMKDYYANGNAFFDAEHISVPCLVLHSIDDPITDIETIPVKNYHMCPNVFFFITEKGGHVGWPTGFFPSDNGWQFMSEAVSYFLDAVLKVKPLQFSP